MGNNDNNENNGQAKGLKQKIRDSRIAQLIRLLPKPFAKKSSELHYIMTANIGKALTGLEKAALKLATDAKTAKEELKKVDQKLFEWCSASQRWEEAPGYFDDKLELFAKVGKCKTDCENLLKTYKPALREVHKRMDTQPELQKAYEALKEAEQNPELKEYDLQI